MLEGKIAWVTGAGSGIGEAAAIALAKSGATVVLTGRRRQNLERVAAKIGANAHVRDGDLMQAATAQTIADDIKSQFGRLDILVNNAGLNIVERNWTQLSPEGIDQVLVGNLSSAFYCVTAVLPMMRAQKDGLLIHTASWAGRFPGNVSGAAYSAAKHGVVAMSHTINMQECINGIRSSVVCPGEVATEILDKRPIPVSAEDRAKMVQSEDCGDLIRYIACLPPHVCINEVLISPAWNRGYVATLAGARQGVIAAPGMLPQGRRVYAVGDIHGCDDRLAALHDLILDDLEHRPAPRPLLIHLGDYVDRGPDSAAVVARLAGGAPGGLPTINLVGNHERTMLDALDGHNGAMSDWMFGGGAASLASWGLDDGIPRSAWREALPPAHLAFLRALKLHHREGDYFFVHAGVRPRVALADQAPEDLLSIRMAFLYSDADFGAVIVHGHTHTATPVVRPNRIGIDTGAVFGGTLTCVVLEENRLNFLSV